MITITSFVAPEAEKKPLPPLHEDKKIIDAKRDSKPTRCFIIFIY
jgi:hypothetical protein